MAKWEIKWYDSGTDFWVPLVAEIDQIRQELTGDSIATFWLANTAAHLLVIQADLQIKILFDSKLQFSGILCGGDLGPKRIKAVCYERVPLFLDQYNTYTHVWDLTPANTIIADALSGTGLTSDGDTEPTTDLTAVFYNANRLDAIKFIAESTGKDFWSEDGTEIKWGVRGSGNLWAPTTLLYSTRGIDRSKKVDIVRVRGIDVSSGYHIVGVAGTGTKTKVLDETRPTDEAGLNAIAARRLAELNTDSAGAPISCLMTSSLTSDDEGADMNVGDSVTLVNAKYLLNGNYRILQLIKKKVRCDFQVEKVRKTLDKEIADLKSWENKGIYLPGSTSWSVNLQGLIGLYHLNEGTGTVAKDKAPHDTTIDGTIVNGSWSTSSATHLTHLEFSGGSSYVDLGTPSITGIDFHAAAGVGNFSVGAWFSPSATDSTKRFIAHKDGQFALSYKVSTGVLTFEFVDASNTVRTYDSDPGLIKLAGRICVKITYDGAYVRMYYNGQLHKSFAQTDNIHSSSNKVYLGVFLKGIESEVDFWLRCLVDQEVLELYFFPLLRVVGGGGGGAASGWDLSIDVSSPQHGTTTPSGVSHQNTGESLEVLASKINVAVFKQWRFDGAIYSTDNPVTIPAQDDGSFHALIAEFTGAIGVGTPIIAQIMGIRDIHILTPLLGAISTYVATPILSALVSAIATVVSAVASSAKWLLDVSYSPTYTMSPVGWQVLVPGATGAVTATPNAQQAALGYVTHISPFKLDGGASVGTTDSSGVASYTVPAQTNNTLHQLIVQSVFGWGCSGSGTTTDAYATVASGSFKVYSRSSNPDGSHHSVWTLDGSIVGGNTSSYTVAAQTNGTYHLIVHQIVAN